MNGAFASELLPPANDEVAIRWINLDEACLPLRFFARDQRGSAAPERIENQVATMRTIADGTRHKSDRLDGRMHGQFIKTIRTETVGAGIGPDVAPIAAMPAKIDIVDVLTAAILPDKNQFMLA